MDIQTLSLQLRNIEKYFDTKFPEHSREYRILARLSKITEELGELTSAVHSELNLQREEKQSAHTFEHLESEWADVFNTVMLFGLTMKIDMEAVIQKRLKEINTRYKIEE